MPKSAETISRCAWSEAGNNPLMIAYHDNEWGTAVHDDSKHFEFLLLDGFQAGLSWNTIINKRANFSKAFDQFDYHKIAMYSNEKLQTLMLDEGIIRNRLKIWGAVKNAQAFLNIQKEYGSFDKYIWQFTEGKTIKNKWGSQSQIPATNAQSDAMSKALKKKGFTFVGSTICYAYMQAAGMINDHATHCFRYSEV